MKGKKYLFNFLSVREQAVTCDFLRSDWLLELAVFSSLLTTVNGILTS